ncbi:MAG: CAP domain-containing protein [Mariprofundales bacterium]
MFRKQYGYIRPLISLSLASTILAFSLSACTSGQQDTINQTSSTINQTGAAINTISNLTNTIATKANTSFSNLAAKLKTNNQAQQITTAADSNNAIAYINTFRKKSGLLPISPYATLNAAAQNHAAYIVTNYAGQPQANWHAEVTGTPGFTGVTGANRVSAANASNSYPFGIFEVIVSLANPYQAIDNWLNSAYHQIPLFMSSIGQAGFGNAAANGLEAAVLDMTQDTVSDGLIHTYPADKQTNIPISFAGREVPDPLATSTLAYPVGQPIGVYGSGGALNIVSALLMDSLGNTIVLYVLDKANDPHTLLAIDQVLLIPSIPLNALTTYTVSISGSHNNLQLNKTWSFKTR